MFGVLIGHYYNYGMHIYGEGDYAPFTINVTSISGKLEWSIFELIKLVTLVSVNCYILITGYFMVNQTKFRIKGIWNVWSTTWLYSVCIYSIFLITNNATFSFNDLLVNIAPIYSNTYWFVTSYLFIMLIAPALSFVANHLTHRQYICLLVVGFVLCFQPFLGRYLVSDQQLLLFIYLFFVGGYLQKYQPSFTSRQLFCAFTGMLLISFAYTIFKNHQLQSSNFMIYAMHYHGLILPLSISVFLLFRQLRVPQKYHSFINAIAPLSFAVYIIHTQPNIHETLWGCVTCMIFGMNHWLLLLHCITTCALVFILCVFIEKIRRLLYNQIKRICGKCYS